MPVVTAPGIGVQFEVTAEPGPDGGFVFLITPSVSTVGGVRQPVSDADGQRMPSLIMVRDGSGVEVPIGDAANQAARVFLAGGATIEEQAIDSAPFAAGIDGGPRIIFVTGIHPRVPVGTNQGVPRMSDDRIIYVSGPPRDLQVQTPSPIRLTTTGEVTLLAAGAADVYHDLRHLFVTTNYTAQQDPSIELHLRDTTGGTIRWTVALGEKAGANVPYPVHRNQTSPGSIWTAQLSAAPPAGRAIILNAEAEKRLA